MRGHPLPLAALVGGLLLSSWGQGADPEEPLAKYPKAGAVVPGPFHVLNMNGDRKGRFHCLICRNSNRPVAALLVRLKGEDEKDDDGLKQLEPGQPVAKLLKELDFILDKAADGNMGIFVVFYGGVDDDVPVATRLFGDKALNQKGLVDELGLKHIIFAADSKAAGYRYFKEGGKDDGDDKPDPKAIPADRFVKVLLYNNYKLANDVLDFNKDKPLTDKDVDAIGGEFLKMVPPPFVNRKKQKN